jgi:Zn-dependent protease with chaperone function
MLHQHEALYFDGISTIANSVTTELLDDTLIISYQGNRLRCVPINDIDLSIMQKGAFAICYFPSGASLQVTDAELILKLPLKNTFSNLLSTSWRGASVTLFALIALVYAIHSWGIPGVADEAAKLMPATWAENIETTVMKDIDSNLCKASELPTVRQTHLLKQFSLLQTTASPTIREVPQARLIFRSCALMGPNAFNVGREIIVLTDEMVKFADDDAAILGILAHELGHLEGDHVMRGILRYAGVGVVATALLGDVSSIVAAAPTLVMRNQFSQVFEREADAHALSRMRAAGISTKPLAAVFKKLSADDGNGDGKKWEWLFSHPDSGERAKLFDDAP